MLDAQGRAWPFAKLMAPFAWRPEGWQSVMVNPERGTLNGLLWIYVVTDLLFFAACAFGLLRVLHRHRTATRRSCPGWG